MRLGWQLDRLTFGDLQGGSDSMHEVDAVDRGRQKAEENPRPPSMEAFPPFHAGGLDKFN